MSRYSAPLRDMRFALFDVLDATTRYRELGIDAAQRDVLDAVLEEAARFTGQVLAPLNQSGDAEGCRFDPATAAVTSPTGFVEAYRRYVAGGWPGLTAPEEFGGQGLPESVGILVKEMIDAANLAWGNYPLLSHGATEALRQHGADWHKEVFLRRIVSGEWTGTMCLTEAHAGSDLGLLRTRAEPAPDGSHAITGTKIFITAGEHDLSSNIVHLVLARLPDAPAGTRGISLFVVPKFKVDHDGESGERNSVVCGSIEEKMGIHASSTCVMHFDGAQGWLIGDPHRGLAAMFTMMNTARLAVGVQGLGLIDRAYQNALAYARQRHQMRSMSADRPEGGAPADPILVHPDVRRMLLTCKAFAEGGRLMALHAALLVDEIERTASPADRAEADALLSFLTPVVKACLTEWSVECTYHALQCFGGHGYVREAGMEQLARDARITTIYEGTTQIQALDLLARKVLAQRGAGLQRMAALIDDFCSRHRGHDGLGEFAGPLADALAELLALGDELAAEAPQQPEEIGAAAVDYLFHTGYVLLGYWWARAVEAADAGEDADLRAAKRETARFYFARILPRTLTHAACIRSGSGNLMRLVDADFDR